MEPTNRTDETWPESDAEELLKAEQDLVPIGELAAQYLAGGFFSIKAQRIFERAAEVFPDNATFQQAVNACRLIQVVNERIRRRGTTTTTGAPTSDLRKKVEDLSGQFPGSADLAKCLGDVRLLDGDWPGACQAYRLAQSCGYPDDQAIVNSGRLALTRPDCPTSVLDYFGGVALALGQFPQAAEFAAESLRRFEGDRAAKMAFLDPLFERLLPRLEVSAEKQALLIQIVRTCIELELMERALAAFRHIDLSGFPQSDLVKRIARYLIDREDYRQAFDYLSRVAFDNETKSLVNEIAFKLEQRGEIDTAVHLLRYMNEHDLVIQEGKRVVEIQLEFTTTREMADRCFRNTRYNEAFVHYLSLVRRGASGIEELADRIDVCLQHLPNPRVDDLLLLGEYFHWRRSWRHAETFLLRALELDSHHERACELLRSIYDSLLKTDPKPAPIRLRSGDLYLTVNRIEDAIEEYKKALEVPEHDKDACRRLAAAYLRAGNPSMALDQYQGLELQSSDLELLYALHESLMNSGNFPRALQAATMIYEFDNRYRDVEVRIAQLQQSLRQQDGSQGFRDPKMVELIGEEAVGRYRYFEQIGSGGMGIVHKVYDLKNECVVAMKILRESLTGSSKAIDRFFREARIASTLCHPNIVNIYDYNINSVYGKSYISMEYVDGPSLRDIIEDRFSTTSELTSDYIAEILYYVVQLCSALETTHLKGIIHRDIKPDNIMITSEKVVKITDFGIVHIEEATFTPSGALIGTPRYMSPEQVRGGRVDCRSDIYAVGIILYESLLGTPPFVTGDIAYQHVNVPPTPPREVNASIPEEIEAVILRCLQKDPAPRFQSAKDLGQAVENALLTLYPKMTARFPLLSKPSGADSGTITQ
jgi:tetratricopeptide (TPR) repeat protein